MGPDATVGPCPLHLQLREVGSNSRQWTLLSWWTSLRSLRLNLSLSLSLFSFSLSLFLSVPCQDPYAFVPGALSASFTTTAVLLLGLNDTASLLQAGERVLVDWAGLLLLLLPIVIPRPHVHSSTSQKTRRNRSGRISLAHSVLRVILLRGAVHTF